MNSSEPTPLSVDGLDGVRLSLLGSLVLLFVVTSTVSTACVPTRFRVTKQHPPSDYPDPDLRQTLPWVTRSGVARHPAGP